MDQQASKPILYFACGVDLGAPSNGAVVHVNGTVRALQELGRNVLVVGRFSLNPEYLGVPLEGWPVKSDRPFSALWNVPGYLRSLFRIIPKIGESDVYVRWGSGAFLVSLMCLLCRSPFFVELNGIYALVRTSERTRLIKSKIAFIAERLCLSRADGIFTTTQELANHYARVHRVAPEMMHVNPCGADIKDHPEPTKLVREKGSKQVIKAKIGYVGGLWHDNGIDTLIESVVHLVREVPHVQVLVAGTSDKASAYKQLATTRKVIEHFEFLGAVPFYEIPELLVDVDLVVAPYNRTVELDQKGGGTPQKIFTYLAAGRTTIVSDLPYYLHFRECSACRFFKAGDAKDLARVIIETLREDSTTRLTNARMARDFIQARYSWRRNAETILDVLESKSAQRV